MSVLPPDPEQPATNNPANWVPVEQLYRDHQTKARRLARWILSSGLPQEVEDVVQDAVVKATRAYDSLEDPNDPVRARNWFLTIVSRTAVDRLRALDRQMKHLPMARVDLHELDAGLDHESCTALTGLPPDQYPILRKAFEFVNGLSEKQRVAYLLEHFFGLDRSDIGQVLGCSAKTVGTHIRRAQAKAEKAFPHPKPSTESQPVQMRRSTA